ncbi:MAG: STAS domain-containing protein [Bacteroidota bacterium]
MDASSSIHLDNALQAAMESSKSIVVDLSKLEYISSAGLGVFISYIEERCRLRFLPLFLPSLSFQDYQCVIII